MYVIPTFPNGNLLLFLSSRDFSMVESCDPKCAKTDTDFEGAYQIQENYCIKLHMLIIVLYT